MCPVIQVAGHNGLRHRRIWITQDAADQVGFLLVADGAQGLQAAREASASPHQCDQVGSIDRVPTGLGGLDQL